MSNNRLSLGAGLSPWQEDFAYNGVDFDSRGKLMDECLQIIRLAMSGDYFEYHGDNYDFGALKLSPVPDRPVPILVGGHSKAALRRAATLGDGWISANTDLATLRDLVGRLQEMRELYGTMEKGAYLFGRQDLPFMRLLKNATENELPFLRLFYMINRTHTRGLDVPEA